MFRKKRVLRKDYDNPAKIRKTDLNSINLSTRMISIKAYGQVENSPSRVWRRLFGDLGALVLVDQHGRCFGRSHFNIFEDCVKDHHNFRIYVPDRF